MRSLAEQALDNLIDQFARPLDFLRELVQNALDAGSPRIEVHGQVTGTGLVLEVRDTGHGMDRNIIDAQLTRLFASAKAGDRTRIGRFGIGFASVFSLRPDRVVVRTGRLDESWEVRFDADRSFEVVPLDTPVVGTTVRVEVAMPRDAAERTLREARWVLGYWCEHTDRPVVFITEPPDVHEAVASDPFAAFSAPTPVLQTVSSPLQLNAHIQARAERDGLVVLVGATDSPRAAFYSHGLTLVNTEDRAVLGPFAERFGHLHIKVAGPGLGHTVTRDNVVHDAEWERAMVLVGEACASLQSNLIDAVEAAALRGERNEDALRWLAAELDASEAPLDPTRAVFVDTEGTARTTEAVLAQEDAHAVVLVGNPDCAVARAVAQQGDFVLQDSDAVRALIEVLPEKRVMWLFPKRRYVRTARERYWTPDIRAPHTLPQVEQQVARHLSDLAPALGWASVSIGDFGTPDIAATEPFAVPAPESDGLVLRNLDRPLRDAVLLNRQHPTALTHLTAWHTSPRMVAFAWLHAAAVGLGLSDDRTDALFQAVST